MAYTDHTWTATITGDVIAEVWGAGGGGRVGPVGGGGGGGAYARTAGIPVVITGGYLARVANTSPSAGNGDTSLFPGSALAAAVGGKAAVFGVPGAGGLAASCTGDVTYSGGDGDTYTVDAGGGGGSSADDASDGDDATTSQGGNAPPRGGDGANGAAMGIGNPGSTPGGGGSGNIDPGSPAGGTGGEGAVVIWEDLGVWPPCGQTPLAVYGSPPASYWAACAVTRAYAFFI